MAILSKYRPTPGATLMQKAVAPEPPVAPTEGAQPPQGFSLPELDPNDPDFAEKQKIHDAFTKLDAHFSQANQGFDYKKHYGDIEAEMAKAPKERHQDPISKLAIAMGTQDPDKPYAPNLGLGIAEGTSKKQHEGEMSEFEKTMEMKRAILSGQIKQHMDAGEFRKALKLAENKALLDVDSDRRAHKNKLEEISAQVTGRENVAKINAKASIERADRRLAQAHKLADGLKLSPSDKAMQGAEIATAQKSFAMATAVDPMTMQRPEAEQIMQAEEVLRQELMRIHNHYEDREIGERPPDAGPRTGATPSTHRVQGEAWKAAGSQ